MKAQTLALALCLFPALAAAQPRPQLRQDRREIRQDQREVRQDQRQLYGRSSRCAPVRQPAGCV